MNRATHDEVKKLFPGHNSDSRFIPYVSMYEFEALYFSDAPCLAEKLGVQQRHIEEILEECGEPEKIDDHSTTAPSKRLVKLSDRFKNTSTGIAIAAAIGIPKMRDACPLFNNWVTTLENLGR